MNSHTTIDPPVGAGAGTARRVAADLVAAGLVHAALMGEAEAVVGRSLAASGAPGPAPAPAGPGVRRLLAEVAGYAGGALVVAAIGIFLASMWSEFSEAGQLVTLVVIALVLAVPAALVGAVSGGFGELRHGQDDVRRRLVSALAVAAAFASALAVALAVDLGTGELSAWPGLAGALTMLLLSAAGYALAPSALGQLATAGAAVATVLSGLELVGDTSSSALVPALCILGVGVLWAVLAESGVLREDMVARFAASSLALFGAQTVLFDDGYAGVAYALTAGVSVAGFALYLRTRAWPYLVAGVLGVTLVVPEAVTDWTDGAIGPIGVVLLTGLTLLTASLLGLRGGRPSGS